MGQGMLYQQPWYDSGAHLVLRCPPSILSAIRQPTPESHFGKLFGANGANEFLIALPQMRSVKPHVAPDVPTM